MRFILVFVLALLCTNSVDAAFYLKSGTRIDGKAVTFDYETKSLRFQMKGSGDTRDVPALDLSLRSRQALLLSPLFHRSYPDYPSWSPEKRNLLLLILTVPILALLIGFWVSGMVLAREIHPMRAGVAFLGSWMIGTTFVAIYLFFASRIGGGYKTVLFGTGLGLVFLSFFVSAIYRCSIFRGLLIFLFQIFVAFFLTVVSLAVSEITAPKEKVENFWNEHVFDPVGMIDYDWFQRVKSSSSPER